MTFSEFPQAPWGAQAVSEPVDTAVLDLGYEVAFPFLADTADGVTLPSAQHNN